MCAFEISIVLFIVVYLFWYYKGKRDNETVAKQFLSNAYPVFSHQCTEIGDGKGHKLVRDGASDYIFYASGRSHIQYILGRLELAKRQDVMQLLSMYLWFLLDAIGLGGLLSMSAPKQDIVVRYISLLSTFYSTNAYYFNNIGIRDPFHWWVRKPCCGINVIQIGNKQRTNPPL